MQMLVLILLVANLLLGGVLLLLLLRRSAYAPAMGSDASVVQTALSAGLRTIREEQNSVVGLLRQDLATQRSELGETLRGVSAAQAQEFVREREANSQAHGQMREELRLGAESAKKSQSELRDELRVNAAGMQKSVEARLDVLRETLSAELEKLRQGNEAKLEKMRETVDEKLQGTLEKRLGESFALVSQRLEQVQKGLGEMQTLATDVGGLKRVLTNVKSRGGWGEVQLQRQLEDVLTPEQYAENVAVIPGSNERVEFAVKLPGSSAGDTPVWLPIDSKFPQEDYERLLTAQENGDKSAIETAGKEVERAVLAQAKLIAMKYVQPPHTTDFGVMYLPTEGLFAEVMRRPGFVSRLQNEHRIAVAGPTTLMSLLNSLQMGFRTLAIEQRSSEVWKVLSEAKTEFEKYGDVWDKVGKQLQTVQNTVSQAGTRTRALQRALKDVESFEAGERALDEFAPAQLTAAQDTDFATRM